MADTFDLTVVSPWEVILPFTSVALDSFESVEFTVQVYIPASASQGDIGQAILTATSQTDPTASDSAILTTYAGIGWTYLPSVYK
jgi:hypothetical protein